MSTSESIRKPEFRPGDVLAGWHVIRQLGAGGFGTVVEVINENGQRAACKAEYADEDVHMLKKEVRVLQVMQGNKHFCELFLAGEFIYKDERVNLMMMTLLGEPLSKKRRQCPNQRFTRSTAVRLAKQCLEAIRLLHYSGFLHRDLKGGNFAWNDANRTVYLLDFGFVRQWIIWKDDGGNETMMRPPRKKGHFLGTSRYASPHVHARKDQGRRDDLWCFLYMVVEFITGKLPWRNDSDRVIAEKKKTVGTKLLKGCPVEFFKMYHHIRWLRYEDKPNYGFLMDMLNKRCGYGEEDPLDFEPHGRHYEYIMNHKSSSSEPSTEGADDEEEEEEEEEAAAVNPEDTSSPGAIEVSQYDPSSSEASDSSDYTTVPTNSTTV
ncbi:unnamed protein product, partial [Mesorhabditis spiculigera]